MLNIPSGSRSAMCAADIPGVHMHLVIAVFMAEIVCFPLSLRIFC